MQGCCLESSGACLLAGPTPGAESRATGQFGWPQLMKCLPIINQDTIASDPARQVVAERSSRSKHPPHIAGSQVGGGVFALYLSRRAAAGTGRASEAVVPALRPSRGRRRKPECVGDDGIGSAQHRGDQRRKVEVALTGGAHDAGQHLLGVGALARAVAATDFAGDDGGTDGLFGAPVGRVDRQVPQEEKHGSEFEVDDPLVRERLLPSLQDERDRWGWWTSCAVARMLTFQQLLARSASPRGFLGFLAVRALPPLQRLDPASCQVSQRLLELTRQLDVREEPSETALFSDRLHAPRR